VWIRIFIYTLQQLSRVRVSIIDGCSEDDVAVVAGIRCNYTATAVVSVLTRVKISSFFFYSQFTALQDRINPEERCRSLLSVCRPLWLTTVLWLVFIRLNSKTETDPPRRKYRVPKKTVTHVLIYNTYYMMICREQICFAEIRVCSAGQNNNNNNNLHIMSSSIMSA